MFLKQFSLLIMFLSFSVFSWPWSTPSQKKFIVDSLSVDTSFTNKSGGTYANFDTLRSKSFISNSNNLSSATMFDTAQYNLSITVQNTYYDLPGFVSPPATHSPLKNFTYNSSKLICGDSGYYFIAWSGSFTGAEHSVYRGGIRINATMQTPTIRDLTPEENFPISTMAANAIMFLNANDTLKLAFTNTSGTSGFTIYRACVSLFKIR